MNLETARHHMIQQQLRTCERMSPDSVDLFYADRRERYAPPACRRLAFADTEIPLGYGATMLTPKLEVRLIEAAAPQQEDRVLLVGAGSGHLAALFAERVGHVFAAEIEPAIAEFARHNLAADGIGNVTVIDGDGLAGDAMHAPFNLIVVAGGVTAIPDMLAAQLAAGGRLLAFVGTAPVMGLRRLTRVSESATSREDLLETVVPMLRAPAAPRFVF